jgi:DNA-binding CsgD family transcriptional regulator
MIESSGVNPIGKALLEHVGKDAKKLRSALRLAFATGDFLSDFELATQFAADSQPRHWLVSLYPLKDRQARVRFVAATFCQISNGSREFHLGNQAHPFVTASSPSQQDSGNGGSYVSDSPKAPGTPMDEPSPREVQVLHLLSQGKSSKEIGLALDISARTVETYRARMMRKLRVHSTAELVRYAIRNRIVEA